MRAEALVSHIKLTTQNSGLGDFSGGMVDKNPRVHSGGRREWGEWGK